jgi:hypothetical protein
MTRRLILVAAIAALVAFVTVLALRTTFTSTVQTGVSYSGQLA